MRLQKVNYNFETLIIYQASLALTPQRDENDSQTVQWIGVSHGSLGHCNCSKGPYSESLTKENGIGCQTSLFCGSAMSLKDGLGKARVDWGRFDPVFDLPTFDQSFTAVGSAKCTRHQLIRNWVDETIRECPPAYLRCRKEHPSSTLALAPHDSSETILE
jgi:hypothetical protein